MAAIQDVMATLHKLLGSLTSSNTLKVTPKLICVRRPEYQTSSSRYASAISEAESDNSGSSVLHERKTNIGCQGEFDPDDLIIDKRRLALVASTGVSSGNQTRAAVVGPPIRVFAISELKEFSGKENDEDRERSYEKCLGFGDLLTIPARNWYRQLSRSTRSNWDDLLVTFQTQYGGQGVSVARKYYGSRKRSDESPQEYLHQLNVTGPRAKLPTKDGPEATRREYVEHFIEMLYKCDLADQLALLRLTDAAVLEDTLRARHQCSPREGACWIQSIPSEGGHDIPGRSTEDDLSSSKSDTGGSGSDDELRQIYVAAFSGRDSQEKSRSTRRDDGSPTLMRCTHRGSSKLDVLGCWKRLTCQKCNWKGHPSDHCLFVCRACGEIHEVGKYPMEELYNLMRQWYVPTKHAGMLPVDAEKMCGKADKKFSDFDLVPSIEIKSIPP
ncbi:LOW QUALITY PROTEIN: Hypothetical protein PHPALM_11368 [Phytophthora palmivora]|uniref:Retrotransposon gag domain-containing protein n=1 Tax=Phytophthora palmivora TaxID=4796 RepID=A0A2P4Y2G8_9STRA|nr:LOW QUALITY PROTEIN: Hypothetical protein PHPALM_11368 [Phytophthora palmivora]